MGVLDYSFVAGFVEEVEFVVGDEAGERHYCVGFGEVETCHFAVDPY